MFKNTHEQHLNFIHIFVQGLSNRAYTSLEWCLNSPPKPHAFASLPLQSKLDITYTFIVLLSSLFSTTSAKLPLTVIAKVSPVNIAIAIPLIAGVSSCLTYIIRQNFHGRQLYLGDAILAFFIGFSFSHILLLGGWLFDTIAKFNSSGLGVMLGVWLSDYYLGGYKIIGFNMDSTNSSYNNTPGTSNQEAQGSTSSNRDLHRLRSEQIGPTALDPNLNQQNSFGQTRLGWNTIANKIENGITNARHESSTQKVTIAKAFNFADDPLTYSEKQSVYSYLASDRNWTNPSVIKARQVDVSLKHTAQMKLLGESGISVDNLLND